MTIRINLAALASGLACFTATAIAGTNTHGTLVAKNAGGPYSQSQSVTIGEGKTKVVFWRVINPDGIDQEMTLDDGSTANLPAYKFTWYKGAKQKQSRNITSQVANTGSGFDFTLPAGDTKVFSTVIKANDDSAGECLVGEASSATTGNIRSAFVGINDGFC